MISVSIFQYYFRSTASVRGRNSLGRSTTGRGRGKAKAQEPVILTLSSDDEDNDSSKNTSKVMKLLTYYFDILFNSTAFLYFIS